MTEIVSEKDQGAYAFYLKNLILEYKQGVNKNLWELARSLKEMRDHKIYRLLDCSSFSEFIASPEIGMSRSAAYALIKRYEIYSLHLNVPENRLLNIDNSKLDIIAPVVETGKDEWLSKAENLSQSDLINEVRTAQGRPEMLSPPLSSTVVSPAPGLSYEQYVREQPCCCCGATEGVEYSHFPRTKAAGGTFGIPLCRVCHTEFHNSEKEWTWTYRRNWGAYLERLVCNFHGGE